MPSRQQVTPLCRYDHGPMKKAPGLWAFDQVKYTGATAADGIAKTGNAFVLAMYACEVCSYVETHDDEAVGKK